MQPIIFSMANYRRNFIEGGSYFFTLVLADRTNELLIDNIELLRQSFKQTKKDLPFDINAIVALPEHLHCIWTLPVGDSDFSTRWKKIKARFSRGIPKTEIRRSSLLKKVERGIWQRRYWEHTLRDEEDFIQHVEYIHYNPVNHSFVSQVKDWPYSSFHRYVRDSSYPSEWAGYSDDEISFFGE